MHINCAAEFPLFCSNSARKCLILPAECSPQESLILAEFIQAKDRFEGGCQNTQERFSTRFSELVARFCCPFFRNFIRDVALNRAFLLKWFDWKFYCTLFFKARARLEMREKASQQDAQDVVEIMKYSLLDAFSDDFGNLDFQRSQHGSGMSSRAQVGLCMIRLLSGAVKAWKWEGDF